MIVYTPSPAGRFGSLEQAIREAEGLLLLLRDPATTSLIFRDIPGAILGACEQPAMPAVNIHVDADTGHLRIVATEGEVMPGALEALEND